MSFTFEATNMKNPSDDKPVFRVLLGRGESDEIARSVQLVIEVTYGPKLALEVRHFRTEAELKRLASEWPFDFICLYVMDVEWGEERDYGRGHVRARELLG